MSSQETKPEDHPWQWEESRWRSVVDKVRAGRTLKPLSWKDGAAKIGIRRLAAGKPRTLKVGVPKHRSAQVGGMSRSMLK